MNQFSGTTGTLSGDLLRQKRNIADALHALPAPARVVLRGLHWGGAIAPVLLAIGAAALVRAVWGEPTSRIEQGFLWLGMIGAASAVFVVAAEAFWMATRGAASRLVKRYHERPRS